jgi:hypothetical protein
MKVDSEGAREWAKVFPQQDSRSALAIRQSEYGGYLMIAATASGGAAVFRIAGDGNLLWSSTLAEGGEHCLTADAEPVSDGGVIIAGHNASRYWLLKVSGNGVEQWRKYYADRLPVAGIFGVTQATDGGYFMLVNSWHVGPGPMDIPMQMTTMWRMNEDGLLLWKRPYDNQHDYRDICPAADGGCLLLGNHGDIHQMNSAGLIDWSKSYYYGGEYEMVDFRAISGSADGDYVAAGIGGPEDAKELIAVHLDADGNLL